MLLTAKQKKAVTYNKGPLLIIAGAGTGKTTILVEKIKYLISKKLAKPEEILALTFTEKAAAEMEDRVDKALPFGYFQTNISTFHSFADKLLRDEIIHIGMSPAYTLHTQAQSIMFLRRNIASLNVKYFKPLSNPNKFLFGLQQHFSRLRDEDISPEDYEKWLKKNKSATEADRELVGAYKVFQEIKRAHNVMDFADLIYYALKLFRTRKTILSTYQKKFKYILVDEFQDTNIAQYELIKLLRPVNLDRRKSGGSFKGGLTVIGDDNQSIYKFRGASISNILTFTKDYKNTKQIVLTENFRSTQPILDSSYKLIKHNDPDTLEARLKISKNLISQVKTPANIVEFELHSNVSSEAESVVNKIIEIKKKNPALLYSDFAILTRANNHSEPFIRALISKQIPFQVPGPGMLLRQPEVKELIAYLELLYDINNSPAFYRVSTMEIFNILDIDLARLVSFSRKIGLSLYESSLILLEETELYKPYLFKMSAESKEKLMKLISLISHGISRLKKDTAGQILFYFLENSGYLAKLSKVATEKEESVAKNVAKFFNKLKNYELQEEDSSVTAVVDYLHLSMELGDSTPIDEDDFEKTDAVTISTVHRAKGLEFNTVFMVNVTQGRFPTYDRKEQIPLPDSVIKEILPVGNVHLQEERRLFYVGMTRAKERLYLTAAKFYGEGKREQKISLYVTEAIGENAVKEALVQIADTKGQLAIFDLSNLYKETPQVKTKKIKNLPSAFSFSQIQTYLTCPLKYKYQYVLKIPVSAGSAASFGDSIHKALQAFYQSYLLKEKPTLQTLLSLYNQHWVPIGYGSKKYEKEMKQEGENMLKRFFKTFHNKDISIAGLEQWFKIKIKDTISIAGKIDRIDYLKNGAIEIIDYKTGKVPSDADLKKEMQLSLYALAATDSGLYGKNLESAKLSYIYFQENKKITLTRTQKDLETVSNTIKEVVSHIKAGEFEAHVGPWCSWCPFKINCEAWQ